MVELPVSELFDLSPETLSVICATGGLSAKRLVFWLRFSCSAIRLVPHALLMLRGPGREIVALDVNRWSEIIQRRTPKGLAQRLYTFVFLMTDYGEFRNLFYYRTGTVGKAFRFLCPPLNTLFIRSGKIGPGLFIQHGFATTIGAEEIGANCWINQQVTIGWADGSGRPRIGDNVRVSAGAKVLGNINVGSNVAVGANAVVIKSVPGNCTVVGVPARIVRREGKRVEEAL
ncbi:hypothetical protein [Niveibacterium sp. SC-1]|uniref:serine O-acetyltransferase n=1 Tax=Niveibacterium sp. SC-1 TaxID=3135646 RepID=UPI00311DDDEA